MKALGGAPGQSQEHLHLWAFPPSSARSLLLSPSSLCKNAFRLFGAEAGDWQGWAGLGCGGGPRG